MIFRGGKLTSWIACVGQTLTHFRQSLHLRKSMYAKLFSRVMASKGHSFTHFPHPMQAAVQALRAMFPLSLFTQQTKTRRSFTPLFRNSMMFLGQAFTQAPHALHASPSTTAMPFSIWIASNLHAFTQFPKPRHPFPQLFGPPPGTKPA